MIYNNFVSKQQSPKSCKFILILSISSFINRQLLETANKIDYLMGKIK